MLLFRWMLVLALLGSLSAFILYVGSGDARFKRYGWLILKWALIAAFGFFGMLILERVG